MPKTKPDFTPVTFVRGDQTRVAYSAVSAHRYRDAGYAEQGEPAVKRPTRGAVAKARAAGQRRADRAKGAAKTAVINGPDEGEPDPSE